jgi:metal-sulfur cluster biosynthetic enzyme
MIKKTDIIKELKKVIDPHIGIDIYTLGFIYNIDIDKKNNVKILMTLTTPACPLASFLLKEVHDAVKSLSGVGEVEVELTFDPPWQAPVKIKKMFKF